MSLTAHDIIIKPIITEKSMTAAHQGKYTFKVANVNKIEIAKAIETVFPGTEVVKVNTMWVRGRMRTQGRHSGYTAKWKKAIVTLTEDSKPIEVFEGMM